MTHSIVEGLTFLAGLPRRRRAEDQMMPPACDPRPSAVAPFGVTAPVFLMDLAELAPAPTAPPGVPSGS
jgi:hypothetical protein